MGAVRAADVADEGADDKSLVLVLVMFYKDRLTAAEKRLRDSCGKGRGNR